MGLAMIPSLVTGLFGAASAIYQGRQQAAQYEAQAAAAESNRRLSELQASESLKEGAREEKQFRLQARQFQATQESQLAASGAQMSGSAANIAADTAQGIEQDAATVRYNTLKRKWGYDVQAVNYGNEADAARTSAKNAKTAGYIGAAGSLLGMAAGMWSASPVKGTYQSSYTPAGQAAGQAAGQPVAAAASGGRIAVGGAAGMAGQAAPAGMTSMTARNQYKTGWWR